MRQGHTGHPAAQADELGGEGAAPVLPEHLGRREPTQCEVMLSCSEEDEAYIYDRARYRYYLGLPPEAHPSPDELSSIARAHAQPGGCARLLLCVGQMTVCFPVNVAEDCLSYCCLPASEYVLRKMAMVTRLAPPPRGDGRFTRSAEVGQCVTVPLGFWGWQYVTCLLPCAVADLGAAVGRGWAEEAVTQCILRTFIPFGTCCAWSQHVDMRRDLRRKYGITSNHVHEHEALTGRCSDRALICCCEPCILLQELNEVEIRRLAAERAQLGGTVVRVPQLTSPLQPGGGDGGPPAPPAQMLMRSAPASSSSSSGGSDGLERLPRHTRPVF